MALYKVSYTPRVVSCKQCKGKLVRGELRVDKGTRQGAYHARCIFDSFAGRKQGEDIQSSADLLGWDDLLVDDQVTLEGEINQYIVRKNANTKSDDGGSLITNTTTPSTSSTSSDGPSTSTCNSIPPHLMQGLKRAEQLPPPIVLSDSESDDPSSPPPKAARISPPPPPVPVLPNLLAGVAIPPGPPRTYDECAVCLDQPVHPVTLPCSHIFCYLCAKGLTRQAGTLATCSLCRKDIPEGFLESAQVLATASQDLDDTLPEDEAGWQWFYQGRNGWWKFEERNNEELEENYSLGQKVFETMICGNLYIIDFGAMEQYQKGFPNRKRKIKRDSKTIICKGVAGLQKRKWIL